MERQQIHIKRRSRRRRVCAFCADHVYALDYKETGRFKRYVTDRGKIYPRRNSGFCAGHQRMLSIAVKRARFMGLIPYSVD